MVRVDRLSRVEVSDGAGDLEDAVVCAGAKIEIGHGGAQNLLGFGFHATDPVEVLAAHAGVAVGTGFLFIAILLDFTGADDPLADGGGGLSFAEFRELLIGDRRHFDMDIDTVEQRAGYLTAVTRNLPR